MSAFARASGTIFFVQVGNAQFFLALPAFHAADAAADAGAGDALRVDLQVYPVHSPTTGVQTRRVVELTRGRPHRITDGLDITFLGMAAGAARLEIVVPPGATVRQLQVHGVPIDDDAAGSRVPAPPLPRPPSLDARLDEPRSE